MDDDIEQQALAWYDRLQDRPSASTRRAFEAWLEADPRHGEAFEQQDRLATGIRAGGYRGVMPERRAQRSVGWLGYGLAGTAAAAVALILIDPQGTSVTGPATVAASMPALTQARRLPDGSLVVFAAGAEVTGGASGDPRSARLLRGAARFLIVHDPAHPFRVTAGGLVVTARGTVFDVSLTPGGARVALAEGRVDVTRMAGSQAQLRAVTLKPGEELVPGFSATRCVDSTASAITWVEVDGMTLADLLTIAARSNGDPIRFEEPELAALRVTGRFDLSSHAALAEKLAAGLDLQVSRRAGGFVLGLRK